MLASRTVSRSSVSSNEKNFAMYT
jgi:hypothetical protein